MKRPKKLSGEQGKYIEYLEEKYSHKKSAIRSYLSLKAIVDDTNNLVLQGIRVVEEDGKSKLLPIVSGGALMYKDKDFFERIFKFINKLTFYVDELDKLEGKFSEEEIEAERKNVEKNMKGDYSVEAIVFGGKEEEEYNG